MIDELRDKRIALLVRGVENRALARFFRTRDIPFAVCDARAEEDAAVGARAWRRYLSEHAVRHGAGLEVIEAAERIVRQQLQYAA